VIRRRSALARIPFEPPVDGLGPAWILAFGALLCAGACQLPEVKVFEAPRVTRGAVVSEHPLATGAGLEILSAGGNAADAAVATALALAVVYPQAGNLGGGGFAVWAGFRDAPQALDFREVAPRSADPGLYLDAEGRFVPERSVAGPLAVGVPGSPLGLHTLFRKRGSGRLSWAEVVAPALRLAREGFEVDPWLAWDLREEGLRERMNAAARAIFYPAGQALRAGQQLVQPELAGTLEAYAARGPAAFSAGPIAEALVATLQREPVPAGGAANSGRIELADLRAYEVTWPTPLIGRFQGSELIAMPPPSSGGLVVLQVLAILEGLPLGSELNRAKECGAVSELMAHWWIEALRKAFADRAEHMGDPRFHPVPVEQLLSAEWVLERRSSIGPRADLEVSAWVPPPPVESRQTTHLSVVDEEGLAVSLTTTLNGSFGSGIVVPGYGFLLNNELDDFAIQAGAPNQFGLVGSRANAILPGKRPLSSMSPMLVRDDRGAVRLVLGSPGGPRIITSVFQVLVRVLLFEQGLHEAVRAARLHQQWRPETTLFESSQGGGWDATLVEALRARGQPVEVVERRFGSVQAISIDRAGRPLATSDPRRGGAAGVEGYGVQAPSLPRR
jgi:gamma-glutamyltranspeptidase/glutathione hydrolase